MPEIEREFAVHCLPEREAEAVLIAPSVAGAACELFGGHVERRTGSGTGAGQAAHRRLATMACVCPCEREGAAFRQAEVGDDHATVALDEHVVRLEVAMHQAGPVDMREPATRLEIKREPAPPVAGFAALQLAERAAVDEFHGDVGLAFVRSDLVDGHEVRVVDPGERLGFEQEPFFRDLRVQDLERDLAFELGVERGEHDAHAAAADLLDQRESADLRGAGGADDARHCELSAEVIGRAGASHCAKQGIDPHFHSPHAELDDATSSHSLTRSSTTRRRATRSRRSPRTRAGA
ncbi:hypothetical protein OV203_08710 [Nannocystis sp. ILAH1]|uniref:hypothetical protein n=1 Tax=Nannocystis sp. ILAH1 TaxID=2996789 RepID=UPI0022719B22|nr:hypothetical protein [Nannocystis sp. ILAH1]MCY0987201.1 hypothetical protein [Nannocystis sp. ILAH1]